MKVTYLERIEHRNAWQRSMYCGECGNHEYEIVEQLEPQTDFPWSVRCPDCGHTTRYPSISRGIAIARWKQC